MLNTIGHVPRRLQVVQRGGVMNTAKSWQIYEEGQVLDDLFALFGAGALGTSASICQDF